MKKRVLNKFLLTFLIIAIVMLGLGCSSSDPYTETAYFEELWTKNISDSWVRLPASAGGGGGLWKVDGSETQLITPDEVDMQGLRITNVLDPALAQDAATKKYVDDNGGIAEHGNEYHNPDFATEAALTTLQGTVSTHTTAISNLETGLTTHVSATTGIHGVGGSTVESAAGSQAKVDAHKNLTTGVHGVTGTIADVSDIAVDANLSAAGQDAIAATHTQGTDTTLGAQAENLDMGGFAITAVGNVDGVDVSGLSSTVSGHTTAIGTLQGLSHTQGTDTALGAVGTKNPPIDADKVLYRDSTSSDALVTSTWTQIKAFLKTYLDTVYATLSALTNHEADTSTHGAADIADVSDIAIDANLSAAGQDAIAKKHTQGADTSLGIQVANLDMGGFAITSVGNVDGVDVSGLSSTVGTHTTAISGLDTRLTTAEGSIATLISDLDTAEAAIVTAEADIDTLESDLTTHEADTSTHGAVDIADVSDIAIDTNLSTAAQDTITAKHTQGTDTTLGTLTADVNFASYMAVAMVCDSGAVMPIDPGNGQWFLQTGIGRTILYQYSGAWLPVFSVGTMTVYVDSSDGTDDLNHGSGVDSNAFATVQYAIDCIPGVFGGNVIISVNDETYVETVTIQGKNAIGNYAITLQGTLIVHATYSQESAVKGVGATMGSITDTGAFTGHSEDLLYSSSNDEYRVIDSATANVGTIVGYWTAVPSGSYTICQWGTTINRLVLEDGQLAIQVKDIYIQGNGESTTAPMLSPGMGSSVVLYRCKLSHATDRALWTNTGRAILYQCLLSSANSRTVVSSQSGYVEMNGCKVNNKLDSGQCIEVRYGAQCLVGYSVVDQPCVLDGTAGVNKALYGINCHGNGYTSCENRYNIIRNCDTGIYAYSGGMVEYTANNQYSGNTADETPIAASFGYID